MTARFAIYFAPARDSLLWARAHEWLAQPDLATATLSARRYGFHATLKAPMILARSDTELDAALTGFASAHRAVTLGGLAPRLIDGFVALTTAPQPRAVNDLAARLVEAFEPFRMPLTARDRERRLRAPLTARQIELLDAYGYPYVLEQFQFHMTLTDRLSPAEQAAVLDRATAWFAPVLAQPVRLDRLVLFTEPEPGAAFVRLDPDYVLGGA